MSNFNYNSELFKEAMAFTNRTRYYYLPDDNRYARKNYPRYYWINNGKIEPHQSYIDIDHGDIYAIEISEKEFYDALEKSKNKVEGYE